MNTFTCLSAKRGDAFIEACWWLGVLPIAAFWWPILGLPLLYSLYRRFNHSR